MNCTDCFVFYFAKKKKKECHSIFPSIIANSSVELSFGLPYMDISEKERIYASRHDSRISYADSSISGTQHVTSEPTSHISFSVPNASSQFTSTQTC